MEAKLTFKSLEHIKIINLSLVICVVQCVMQAYIPGKWHCHTTAHTVLRERLNS